MIDLEVAQHRIRAWSVGGVETCFIVPVFDACLDIGRCPPGAERQRNLLLTHAHIDHAAGLPYYISMRGLMSAPRPRVYCPKKSLDALSRILKTWAELQADTDRCTLVGVEPGDEIALKNGGRARVFRSPHRISTVGYTLYSRKSKLRPELQGLPTEQIADRARGGEKVSHTVETAEICFPGDTRIEVVESEESVRTARVLLLECTFVGSRVSRELAKKTGHVHLDQIAERAELFENEVVVLTHFSRRHSLEEIQEEVARLPQSLRDRVRLLHPDLAPNRETRAPRP